MRSRQRSVDGDLLRRTDASTFPRKTIEITTKHLILCSSINMWRKTLKTPNKLAGPVGKERVSGGVNSLGGEMQEKPQKNITEPVTK